MESVWLRPADWYHPAVDALVESVLADSAPAAAAQRLGDVRARAGVGIGEAIDDLACLYRSLGRAEPPLVAVRALCAGWAAAQAAEVVLDHCVDPESGLATREYLVVRLAETYGTAARAGTSADRTHTLLLVDVATGFPSPWERMARSAAVGGALSATFGDGHPMASLGGGFFAVLVGRDEDLGAAVRTLRDRMAAEARELEIPDLVRTPPRLWIEPLPTTHERAAELLEEIRR